MYEYCFNPVKQVIILSVKVVKQTSHCQANVVKRGRRKGHNVKQQRSIGSIYQDTICIGV